MSLSKISGILSSMQKTKTSRFNTIIDKFGKTGKFNYATDLQDKHLPVWSKLEEHQLSLKARSIPKNGFEELISLTEEGKLWKFPIDNEQGLEEEQKVPFEDHIFFDNQLEKFSKNEYVQSFMELVVMGLGNNHWMNVERKREIIDWYLKYFEEKKDTYKNAGFEL